MRFRFLLYVFTGLLAVKSGYVAAQEETAENVSPSDIEIEAHYPETLRAGAPFVLRLRVRNHSNALLSTPGVGRSRLFTGEHADSFDYQRCHRGCQLSGTQPVEPGGEILIEAGTFHYRNPELFSGDFGIGEVTMIAVARDDDGGAKQLEVPLELPHDINVQHPPGTIEDNPAENGFPSRSALEIRDLATPGDQRLLHDPNTGNDWLRMAETTDLTQATLEQKTVPGGEYEGFNVAYAAQVETLALNHVHAENIDIRAYELAFRPSMEVRDSVSRFLEKIRITQEGLPIPATSGAVRDRPPLQPELGPMLTVVALHGQDENGEWRISRSGPARSSEHSENIESSDATGVWLVRTPQTEPQRPADRASYYQDILVIPDVVVDGEHYRAEMIMENEVANRLRLTGLDPLASSADAIPFDTDGGTLALENAVWLTPEGERQYFDLQLTYLPGSEPAVFHITAMTGRDQGSD